MSTQLSPSRSTARPRLGRIVVALFAAILVAVILNALVAAAAIAMGASPDFGPLSLSASTVFTIAGVLVGWIGWSVVRARAKDPRRVLSILVPVVTLLTLVPDVLLLAFRFIPGTTTSAAIALMVMHLVVVAVAIPAYVLASRPVQPEPVTADAGVGAVSA